jgi:hypothetical protein
VDPRANRHGRPRGRETAVARLLHVVLIQCGYRTWMNSLGCNCTCATSWSTERIRGLTEEMSGG